MIDPNVVSFYSTSQYGGELPYFVGQQYGAGWLSNMARMAIPLFKRLAPTVAKTAGKAIIRSAADAILNNQPILPSVSQAISKTAKEQAPAVLEEIKKAVADQDGGGRRFRKRTRLRKAGINKRRKKTSTIFD